MAGNAPDSAPESPLELGTTGWRRTQADAQKAELATGR
jgi:hypothetical protein